MSIIYEMPPDEVCGWIQKHIRRELGDKIENLSEVYAAHGYYYITVPNCKQLILRRKNLSQFWKKLRIKKSK